MSSKKKANRGLINDLARATKSLKKRHFDLAIESRNAAELEQQSREQIMMSKWSSPDGRVGIAARLQDGQVGATMRVETPSGYRSYSLDLDTLRGLQQWLLEMFGEAK